MNIMLFHHQIVAEIGSVHDGSIGNAKKLIELAAKCGAGIVKFQTHIAESETLREAPSPSYFTGEPRYEYFERTGFNLEQWRELAEHCRQHSVKFLSSPFSEAAVDLLEQVGVQAYKVASGEVSNIPLLERIAETGKPVLLSSGMSCWDELDQAVEILGSNCELVVMQCTSSYPCQPDEIGLNVVVEMRSRWGYEVGFSDHTLGMSASIAAAALGATVIEKHLTFSKDMYGSDAANAMEPTSFAQFCAEMKDVWCALEHPVDKQDVSRYRDMKRIFEKSVVAAKPIKKGQVIDRDDLSFKKPGSGIPAKEYKKICGAIAVNDIAANTLLSEKDFE
ncbi:N-acetylneuraminate synthase family protein [Thalassospira alkalitolerans]|uniref:N-acetylneuraminate synthase family protein n=1 Tax=Thalassospira alkalitolerans TaxID=1293890 RepID=UPI0030ECA8D2|tara:strand:- start:30755 stop:31759 length:1005 start_codon:yes stop_codon:yes gene_type:complete